jgi:OPT oligopeptide transporter protein
MTFDWSQIAYIGSPLIVPLWAALNIIGGLVIVMWIIAPIMCTPFLPRFLDIRGWADRGRLLQCHGFIIHADSVVGCI